MNKYVLCIYLFTHESFLDVFNSSLRITIKLKTRSSFYLFFPPMKERNFPQMPQWHHFTAFHRTKDPPTRTRRLAAPGFLRWNLLWWKRRHICNEGCLMRVERSWAGSRGTNWLLLWDVDESLFFFFFWSERRLAGSWIIFSLEKERKSRWLVGALRLKSGGFWRHLRGEHQFN